MSRASADTREACIFSLHHLCLSFLPSPPPVSFPPFCLSLPVSVLVPAPNPTPHHTSVFLSVCLSACLPVYPSVFLSRFKTLPVSYLKAGIVGFMLTGDSMWAAAGLQLWCPVRRVVTWHYRHRASWGKTTSCWRGPEACSLQNSQVLEWIACVFSSPYALCDWLALFPVFLFDWSPECIVLCCINLSPPSDGLMSLAIQCLCTNTPQQRGRQVVDAAP